VSTYSSRALIAAHKVYKQTMGLVSKETVALRQWGSETQYFVFIN